MTLGQSLNLSILRQRKAASCLSHTEFDGQKQRAVSTLQNVAPATQPRNGTESVSQSLEKDPSSHHDSGDPFLLPAAGELATPGP